MQAGLEGNLAASGNGEDALKAKLIKIGAKVVSLGR